MLPDDARSLRSALAPFQEPRTGRALLELTLTALPLVAIWAALYVSVANGWWWGLLLSLPAGAFLVRLFLIQHDCGHHAFFRSVAANTWTGRAIGVLTMTPYSYWRRTHAIHHATSGDLDRRGLGAIEMLTVAEFQSLPPLKRLAYRFYRAPVVMLGIGPAYMFLLQHRVPVGAMRTWWGWRSVIGNNLGLAALCGLLIAVVGPRTFLIAHLPVVVIAGAIGIWLFYLQHQFEGSRWVRHARWNNMEAAVEGSSYLHLPQALRWLSADIGAHHVHHAACRIPFYRIPEALAAHAVLRNAPRLRLRDTIDAFRLALWDETNGRMVSFAEARRVSPRARARQKGRVMAEASS